MVQCFLIFRAAGKAKSVAIAALLCLLLLVPAYAAKDRKKVPADQPWPDLLLDGGRKLTYQQTLTSERDVRGRPGFWSKVFDIVAGEPDFTPVLRPYSVAVDSRGRIIVTDPGMEGVHIFDPNQHKYKFIDRWDKSKDPMIEPQCVAVDNKDNIYVTDSKAGKVFLFDRDGKTRRVFGSLKGGEGFFKRPTGIAIDTETRRVYVTDTLRDRVYVLDDEGRVIRWFGQHGAGDGEFNLPTEVLVKGNLVAVVDAMNFRVQLFTRDGVFIGMIGKTGDPSGGIYRPKGIAIDSEEHVYIADGEWGVVQVFDTQGRLLYTFGNGTGFGTFRLPTGLFIDASDRIYLVDSAARRVQIFQYHGVRESAHGAQ